MVSLSTGQVFVVTGWFVLVPAAGLGPRLGKGPGLGSGPGPGPRRRPGPGPGPGARTPDPGPGPRPGPGAGIPFVYIFRQKIVFFLNVYKPIVFFNGG